MFSWLFGVKPEEARRILPHLITVEPVVGQDDWVFAKSADPFPLKNPTHAITILDVNSGWVRYSFNGSSLWTDERMEMSSFLYCYKRNPS